MQHILLTYFKCCFILILSTKYVAIKKKEVLFMEITSQQLETLRIERGRKNLTISSLAQQLGVSRYTMGNIINGKTNGLRTETVHKINSWLTANVHPQKEVANNE